MIHATRYLVPSVRSSVLADMPFLAVLTCHAASNQIVSGVRVLSNIASVAGFVGKDEFVLMIHGFSGESIE